MGALSTNTYTGPFLVTRDRKRKQAEIVPASERFLEPAVQTTDSAVPSDLLPKRQRLLEQQLHLMQMQYKVDVAEQPSFSGPGLTPSSQTLPHADLQWTASDGYSTGNSTSSSVGNLPSMMEEDPQSVMPTVHQQQQNQLPPRSTGLSHSSSAPDLRLLLATELPDTRPLYMPAPGSYAGALVPYKGPEQVIAEAHQHVASDFVSQMVAKYNEAQACQGQSGGDSAVLPDAMQMDLSAISEAPAVYHALQLDCERVVDSRVCKRKHSEQLIYESKRARRSSSDKLIVEHYDSEVDMEDA